MRGHATRPIRHAVVATVAALALAAGLLLEAISLGDRLAAGRGHGELPALAAVARERPSAGAFDALARSQAAAGRAGDAAASAATAARLAPTDVRRAAVAERALDVAARARLRDLSRPVSLAAVATLLLLAGLRLRRARISYAHRRALSGSRARLLLAVEGDGEASGDSALLRPATGALVIDAHVEGPLRRARPLPPLVVALSHATDGRTVRLTPRRDWSDGAARFRVEGASLAQIVAHPGVWRVLLRAGDAILAQGLVEVAAARRTDSLAA